MKRVISGFLTLVMLISLCIPAAAADDPEYVLTLYANNSASTTVKVGDVVTVTLTLSKKNADELTIYLIQDYAGFDPEYLQIVESSVQNSAELSTNADLVKYYATGTGDYNRVLVTRFGNPVATVSSGVTLLTFQAKAIKAGTTKLKQNTAELYLDMKTELPVQKVNGTVIIEPSATDKDNSGTETPGTDEKDPGETEQPGTDEKDPGETEQPGTGETEQPETPETPETPENPGNTETNPGDSTTGSENTEKNPVNDEKNTENDAENTEKTPENSSSSDTSDNTTSNSGSSGTSSSGSSGGSGSSGSSGGGGGGGSTTSTTKPSETISGSVSGTTTTTTDKVTGTVTETTTQTDGTVSTKETKTDGTVTETTTKTDGSIRAVETKTDGTVTEKNTTSQGVVGTVVTNSTGAVTQATAEIPAAATKSEGPVTVPVTVAATKSSASATVVNITVEDNSKAKIEIPVADVKPGVVAIVVKPDGTEEILKTSSISDTGVLLTIDGSADIKLVDNSKDFSDVPETQWYNDSVDFVSAREIMSGTSDDNFSPNVEMSRAMLTQVLYSLEGKPAAGENNFRDVKDSDWFDDAVSWAVENSIISGVGDGQFAPNASLTREQMAVILYGYAKNKGLDTTISGNLGDFKDANKASDWSRTALEWALGAGMISGKGDGILDPTGTSTRAEIATILTGFCKFMAQ